MAFPDQKVYFNPDENLSSQDANFISEFIAQVHKSFVTSSITETSCRVSGLGITYTNNSTPSPTVNIANGIAFFVLPDPKSITDPNNYSGAIFAGGDNIGISAPPLSTRSDAIDITYNEQLGNDGGSIGFQSPRDVIDNLGIITPNVPLFTRKISNYVVTYIPDYPSFNGGQPATGTVRLATFTVTTGGFCSPATYVMPSIWENQDWPTGSPDTADQSQTLADSLASIRYKISQIIGATNWFDSLSGNNILNLLQLGNAPKFWGSNSSGSTPTYSLTIPNYPINSSIIPGTVIAFKPNFTNVGAINVSVNGQPSIPLNDSTNTAFNGGEILVNNLYEITYTGSSYQILGNATPVFFDVKTDVINGSFEEWSGGLPTNWTAEPTLTSATINRENSVTAVDGGNAVRFDILNSGTAGVNSSLIPISALSTYYIQFKTWCTSASMNGFFVLNFYQADGVTPTVLGANQAVWIKTGSYPTSASTYYGIMKPFVGGSFLNPPSGVMAIQIPVDARYVKVNPQATNPGSTQSVWFDDVRFFTPTFSHNIHYFNTTGAQNFRTGRDTTWIITTLVGAGGAGGNQPSGDAFNHGGGGGASGGIVRFAISVLPDTIYTVTVGAGGTTTSGAGNSGGDTTFSLNGSTLIRAFGGGGGQHLTGGVANSSGYDLPSLASPEKLSFAVLGLIKYVVGSNGTNLTSTASNSDGGNGGSISSSYEPYFTGAGGAGAGGLNGGSPPAVAGLHGGGGGGAATGPFNYFSAAGGDGVAFIEQ
jgi:hypothetical protein